MQYDLGLQCLPSVLNFLNKWTINEPYCTQKDQNCIQLYAILVCLNAVGLGNGEKKKEKKKKLGLNYKNDNGSKDDVVD